MAPRILIVLSSHDKLGNTGKPTRWYLPEFAHPYWIFTSAGADVTIASPKTQADSYQSLEQGGQAPLDPISISMFEDDVEAIKFLKEKEDMWTNTTKLSELSGKIDDFDAIYYVGGHGPMFDLATDPDSIELVKQFYEAGKVTSAVCHGPAAFVNVTLSDGTSLVAGQTVTGFSNSEEDSINLSSAMPFMLETALKEKGATFVKNSENWGPKVVESGKNGKLISGQNPASAGPIAEAVLKALASV